MDNMTMESAKIKDSRVWIAVAVAAVLWFVMFSPWTAPMVNFWYAMTTSAVILVTLSTCFCRQWLADIRPTASQLALGLVIALVLWCVFWVGDKVSQLLFSFARPQVDMIYGMKSGTASALIGVLLLLVIGPAEEIFWRGYVQRRLSQRWNVNVGFVVTLALYTLIHVWSFNFMLLMAALVVGAFWGLLYRLRPQWLTALVISHAVWDACAFVFFPF